VNDPVSGFCFFGMKKKVPEVREVIRGDVQRRHNTNRNKVSNLSLVKLRCGKVSRRHTTRGGDRTGEEF
jgi:hypothetical protein